MTTSLVPIETGVDLSVTRFAPNPPPSDGDNEPVTFLLTHGLASNARLWDGVARRLAGQGHPVVTVDQRGHGRSSKPDDGYDMATVADDLASLIGELGLDRPVVGGQSWGGNVVLELANRHVDLLSAAVLVDGGFLHLRRTFPNWEDCADALRPPALAGRPLAEIEGWIDQMAADWPAEGRAAALANFEVCADHTIAPWLTLDRHMKVLRGLWDHDPSSIYRSIEIPVLILAATMDETDDPAKVALVDEAVAALPNGAATWFRPAHHDVHAQHPGPVADALLDFVDSLG